MTETTKYKYHIDGTLPTNNEIFVFGSNLAGRHGKGAAKIAAERFGALYGPTKSRGLYGNSYAIATKDYEIKTRSLDDILTEVLKFIAFSRKMYEDQFWVTAIGCGLAGYQHKDIAPMFRFCKDNCNFPDLWKPYLETEYEYKTLTYD